ncbi:MAG: flagellar M-ring protein FliF [Candidatus Raymondbacteria bacterium RifOxyA12_full_50_37]|uniref:Flagellar M-ring protein n=1 Tax=Candidatus Raymondbacteria bacterium RIFOXYD12_FULL_49_13 TaxID=1817890 RepID=A0A1F7F028_UNCRA|nr:MAG: flagellar M-ring protein FliF [Candidatus Raymondbacteria bacterium RifOxyA12_full_50_37]OGJ92999.1 MAG: flagellar M-ring protein FliF [Candidatus Raymondbacteria bacterium RIFOXYA2_FULL_49_16]OGJ99912.1 MAG: flagellar M-ring protein FliF [Candidatus Raymondbacteria bacterium RIFOXYD12_FULL_49_13]OGK01578.1 MAG: flagellar M-ring protein FliF [Candidatus Raymondbacteria bacterium RifOxyC12_full_50_8]OGP40795.1 MAG: flagellar M-ring protein FliF [Candidatus Raymondbacteria bacterium RIFOX
MADFFKQLLRQLNDIWTRLTTGQKIITASVVTLTFVGFVGLVVWAGWSGKSSSYMTLFSSLDLAESGSIVEQLKAGGYEYKIENDGRTLTVPKKDVYELRMNFAKLGMPKSGGIGYEIFDKTNLGMTDFVQHLNYRRALEGEIARTIEILEEVEKARIHIVIPKETIFIEKQKEPTASVVLKLKPGVRLKEQQIVGIANLVAYSVEGLKPKNVSILDTEGNSLSNAYGSNELAERTSNQLQLQNKVEGALSKKAQEMLEGVLGPNKANVKVSVDLDFEQTTRTEEKFDPESKVVRSEERNEESSANTPTSTNEKRENSITNYEINKTVANIIGAVGTVKKLSISVAVDGIYRTKADGVREYQTRPAEEMLKIEDLVKNAVGYDANRGDQVVVYNLQFDNEFIDTERAAMEKDAQREMYMEILKGAVIVAIILLFIFFLRSVARTIIDAMNPPVPEFVGVGETAVEEEIPMETKRTNELIEKVELISKDDPQAVANIIKGWLAESAPSL